MRELLNIWKDIKSGAMPMKELPGFLLWGFKKKRLALWFAVIVAIIVAWRERR